MDKLKQTYTHILDSLGEESSFAKDWRWVMLMSLVVYGVVLVFRLSFATRWSEPALWVNGERILATHDSYFWLAKAKGIGVLAGYPLAQITAFIYNFFGVEYGTLGFWMPAFVSSLVAIPCVWWGWLLGGRNAGLLAGLVGALTPGFYYRSSLGYFDTDMFTLLGPMLVSFGLAYWASLHIRRGWFTTEVSRDEGGSPWLALALGLGIRLVGMPHADILKFTVLMIAFVLVVLIFFGLSGRRVSGLHGLSLIVLVAFPGTMDGRLGLWPVSFYFPPTGAGTQWGVALVGFVLATGLAAILTMSNQTVRAVMHTPLVCACILLATVLVTEVALLPVSSSIKQLFVYFTPSEINDALVDSTVRGPVFLNVVQSILETQLLPLDDVLKHGVFTVWLGVVAFICMLGVLVFRPISILLLPMVMLHMASVKMGFRFTMFGGAALCVFMGVGICWCLDFIFRGYAKRSSITLLGQSAVAVGILVMAYIHYLSLPPAPVITKAHAEALIELGTEATTDSRIWTWWDWGYASQYFAGLETVVDGGFHRGRDVYPLAFALTTNSFEKSNQVVVYSGAFLNDPHNWVGLAPARQWNRLPRKGINEAIEAEYMKKTLPKVPPQYVVVTWQDLTLSQWISYYGNLNMETGATQEFSLDVFNGPEIGINFRDGMIQNTKGQTGLVKSIALLQDGKVKARSYYKNSMSKRLMPKLHHLLVNFDISQSILMDELAYESVMTRLFVGDPDDPDIASRFKLVVDKLPYVRIYEVVQ